MKYYNMKRNQSFNNTLDCEYYQSNAKVQKFAAEELVKHYKKEISVLEIGFGTGVLTKKLLEFSEIKTLDAIETSEKMFEFARNNIQNTTINFILKEKNWQNVVNVNKKYDLIISNFVFHWFKDLEIALNNLLKIAPRIIFAIPLQESFVNLQTNNINIINTLLNENQLKKKLMNYNHKIKIIEFNEEYADILSFMRHMKKIGSLSSEVCEIKKLEISKITEQKIFNVKYKISFVELLT
jgi:trans-aconitate methyltransferase